MMNAWFVFVPVMLLTVLNAYSQREAQVDSVAHAICVSLTEIPIDDSLAIMRVMQRHYVSVSRKIADDEEDDFLERLFFRMQRNCPEFKAWLNARDPQKGDWEIVHERPETLLSRKDCREFSKQKRFKYLEVNGDTVNLEFGRTFWIDRFKDGTYSKLRIQWINDCEFEIEFLESNNLSRMKLSNKGDKYRHRIVEKTDKYYLMFTEIPNMKPYYMFKLYY